MSSPAPQHSLSSLLTSPLPVVAITAALSVLMLAWAVPSIRPWCLFLGVTIPTVTLGIVLTMWLVSPRAPRPLEDLRQQFVKSLEGTGGPQSKGNPRDGTSAQTANY